MRVLTLALSVSRRTSRFESIPPGICGCLSTFVSTSDDGHRRWLIFSPDGQKVVARLEHSGSLKVLRVDLKGVLGVERDEIEVEHLVYRRVIG